VQPYEQLARRSGARDSSLREKGRFARRSGVFRADEDSVGIGGSTMSRTPMALIWAVIRASAKKLSCSRSIVSSDGDLLFGSGAATT
jgi:glutaconate CoA-transferase subunit A